MRRLPTSRLVCPVAGRSDPGRERRRGHPVIDPETFPIASSAARGPLYQACALSTPRWPISTYIRRKMRKWFDLLILDEAHEAKGQSTDRGHAGGEVVVAAKKTLALTGTLFGGTASSVFYLLHRLSPEFRGEYGWGDVGSFVDRFGVVETTTYGHKTRETGDGYGTYSGLRRRHKIVRERPGVSPGLVRLLLPNTAFVSLEDLGYTLPPFSEIPVPLEMTDPMKETYNRLNGFLKSASHEDHRRLGEYLQTTLSWPNATFREIYIPGLGIVPAIGDEPTPKEAWLVETVRREAAEGRKTLVFVRRPEPRTFSPGRVSFKKPAVVHDAPKIGSAARRRRGAKQPTTRRSYITRVAPRARFRIFHHISMTDYSYVVSLPPNLARPTNRSGLYRLPARCLSTIGHRQKIIAAQLLHGDDISAAFASGGSLKN